MDLLNDIINYLIAQGLAKTKDTDIFKDYAPKKPDSVISVFEYAGTPPASFTRTCVRSIQIYVRAKSKAEARSKIWAIYNNMYREDSIIDIGDRRCIIAMRNTPSQIDVDDQGRVIFTFNLGLTTTID